MPSLSELRGNGTGHPVLRLILSSLVALGFAQNTTAAPIIWDETLSGDLSNDGLNPTAFAPTEECCSISVSGIADHDYFTISIPVGAEVISANISVVAPFGGTGWAFVAIQPGSQMTVDPLTWSGPPLLTSTTVSYYGSIFDEYTTLPLPPGFYPPLGPGEYTFFVRGINDWRWYLNLTFIPEPSVSALLSCGLIGLGVGRRSRRARTS